MLLFIIYFIPFSATSFSIQDNTVEPLQLAFKNLIETNRHSYVKTSNFILYKNSINDLYLLSSKPLLWLTQQSLNNKNITDVFKLIATAKNSGLNKEHYNLTFLHNKWQHLKDQQNSSINDLLMLDTAISINLLHFLSDLHYGRVNPSTLRFNFDIQKDLSSFIPLILESIQKKTISTLAEKVEPSFPIYQQLKKALKTFRDKQSLPLFNDIKYISTIKKGDIYPQIVAIRQRLNYLASSNNMKSHVSCLYDEPLVNSIKDFQLHHGLETDGIIGKKTIAALNISLSERIQQVELALERFRWLPDIQTGPQIIVNIPAFQLWAYNSKQARNTKILNMKVIVGKSIRRKSPIFTAKMYYIEFSPYWNIPKSITSEEIIPKLQENLLYLDQQNMELVTGFHNNEQAISYTDKSIEQLKDGSLKLRQRPGNKNALGRVKFIFPNNYNVYLHDTPSQHLFKKSKRDLSHGCIRVEKPIELADFLLESKTNWEQSSTVQAMTLNQPKQVRLNSAVPVIIFYSTALAMNDEVFFYEDIYGYDAKLKQALINHNSH